jgi:hypothetical protein
MKLWIVKAVEGADPWEPWYDKAFGFVVRADTETRARELAQASGGCEIMGNANAWTDRRFSTCEELLPAGEEGILIQDYHAA